MTTSMSSEDLEQRAATLLGKMLFEFSRLDCPNAACLGGLRIGEPTARLQLPQHGQIAQVAQGQEIVRIRRGVWAHGLAPSVRDCA